MPSYFNTLTSNFVSMFSGNEKRNLNECPLRELEKHSFDFTFHIIIYRSNKMISFCKM